VGSAGEITIIQTAFLGKGAKSELYRQNRVSFKCGSVGWPKLFPTVPK